VALVKNLKGRIQFFFLSHCRPESGQAIKEHFIRFIARLGAGHVFILEFTCRSGSVHFYGFVSKVYTFTADSAA